MKQAPLTKGNSLGQTCHHFKEFYTMVVTCFTHCKVRYSNLASERPRYFLLPLDLLLNHLLDFDNTSRHHRHSCIELVCLYDQPPPSKRSCGLEYDRSLLQTNCLISGRRLHYPRASERRRTLPQSWNTTIATATSVHPNPNLPS
jgi:hypothetical protein